MDNSKYYKPTKFEVGKEWEEADIKENKDMLQGLGINESYSEYSWNDLPSDVQNKIIKKADKEQWIMPPRKNMSESILEPQWVKNDCEMHGGVWVRGFRRDGTWVKGYCRRR